MIVNESGVVCVALYSFSSTKILTVESNPTLKPAFLNHTYLPNAARQKMKLENLHKLDMIYARDYDWMQDLKTIVQQYKNLGSW